MELTAQFEEAIGRVKNISKRPSNEELLKLYGLFKQGSTGDVSGKKPGMFDIKGQAKYKSWEKFKGTSQDEAKQQYIDLVNDIVSRYS